ncbi:craniofacial development protein 2-like [Montipora capricornis]|uniref:craniofacial development protein 2-like n=1 Tax=Montipora capricornis TaxID=246305 RepID=UPI0035F1B5A3
MTLLGQSRKEDQKPTASIVNPKNKTWVGNWNVRTMFQTGKAGQVSREMKRYKIDILGIIECRWRGSGKSKLNTGEVIIYSGEENIHKGGVAIMMSQQAARCLMEWTPESSRIIRARFYSKYRKLTLIHAYSPTNDASIESKDDFYEQLEGTVQKCNRNEILLITGDLNAKVGKGTPGEREVLGQHGTGDRNENGEWLCEFLEMNGLVITGTIFPHKEIHKATWTSPNGRTKNQIDHTMIAKEYRSSVMDTVVRRGADVGSDHHYLVETRLKLKLKRNPREMKGRTRLDRQKLADEEMLIKYNIEVRNRFQALTELDEENADHMNNRMRRHVEESSGKEAPKVEVRKYTFRKSQEKNKRRVQRKRPRS